MYAVLRNPDVFWQNLFFWGKRLLTNHYFENWNRVYEFVRCYYKFYTEIRNLITKRAKRSQIKPTIESTFLTNDDLSGIKTLEKVGTANQNSNYGWNRIRKVLPCSRTSLYTQLEKWKSKILSTSAATLKFRIPLKNLGVFEQT